MEFTLRIPEPCGEDWQKMTPAEQGRVCARCSKEVIDFTRMSQQEIADKIASMQNPCGRFRTPQLSRTYRTYSKNWPKFPLVRKMGMALSIGATLTFAHATYAQQPDATPQVQTDENGVAIPPSTESPSPGRVITGKMIEEGTGEPLPFATVVVKNSSIGTMADENGNFKLEIPDYLDQHVVLQGRYVGYANVEVEVPDNNRYQVLEFADSSCKISVGIIIVEKRNPKRLFNRHNRKHSFDH